jgi:hypothetical protein
VPRLRQNQLPQFVKIAVVVLGPVLKRVSRGVMYKEGVLYRVFYGRHLPVFTSCAVQL